MKIGRNAPCPCGSGKKYKKCCLRKEGKKISSKKPKPTQSLHSLESEHYNQVISRLMQFAENRSNRTQHKEAIAEFFMREDYEEWELEYCQQVFHVWLWFFRKGPHGTSLTEQYLQKHDRSLSPGERQILDTICDEPFRLVEIQEVRLDQGMTLKDLNSGEMFEVRERSATHCVNRWDLTLMRLRRLKEHNEIDVMIPVNRKSRELIMEAQQWLLKERRNSNPDTNLYDVMTEEVPWIFDAIIHGHRQAMILPKLKTSDGEDLLFCTARYRIKDEAAIRRALTRHRSFEFVEADDGFLWHSGYRKKTKSGHPGFVSLGFVKFEKDNLLLEAHSKERLEKGKVLLEKNVGTHLVHEVDIFQDVEQAVADHKPKEQTSKSSLPPEVERQLIEEFQNQYYLEEWPNTPLPALDGITPMQAAKNKKMRPFLIELVKDLELSAKKNPRMAFDVGKLWKLLNLKR